MKHIPLFLFALLAFSRLSAQNEKAILDKVVATVGGEILLLSEVHEQLSYARQQQPNLPPNYDCSVVQNLLMQKLLVNQAKLDSLEVKDEEVENQLSARIDRLMTLFNQDPKAIEEYYGQSVEAIKDQMRGDMRNQLLAERMQRQVSEKATVTPSEVQTFFSRIPKDSLPYFNAEVEIRELIYKPKVNATEKANARKRIEELLQRIRAGEDFAKMATQYSDDPGSGSNGGDLGWQKRGTFVQEFEAVAYNLEKGQISDALETEFGFHIIQLLERRGNLLHARHILIKPEITDDDLTKAQASLDTIRQSIAMNNLTFSLAVKKFGDKNTQSYNNDGLVANPRTGNSFFEIGDLDPDIYFAVEKLQPGEVTAPIAFRGPDGGRYFRLVQLVSRSKPHQADLQRDYNKIQEAALEQKKAVVLEKWVVEKLRNTYLSVSYLFDDCPNIKALVLEAQRDKP